MKILLITDNHSLTGGAERSFFDLKSRLQETPNLKVHSLGYGNQETHGDDYTILTAPRSNFAKLWWRLCFHPFVFLKLRKQIRQIKPDIIHIHTYKYFTRSLFLAIKPYPVIHTTHDFSAICPTAQNIHTDLTPCPTGFSWRCFFKHHVKYHWLTYCVLVHLLYRSKKSMRQTINAYIAPSPLLAGYLEKNHFNPVSYVPPFHPPTQQLPASAIKPGHFLYAGALGQHKGVHILLDEFALACRVNSALKLYIAGVGQEEINLRQQVKTLGIEKNVVFVGWQSSLTTLIAQSVAVIFPSIGLEAFGLSMTEAMSAGRAVIGANRGTIAWLLKDHHTGLLFDPTRKGDLAKQLIHLANNTELYTRLGISAFKEMQQRFNNSDSLEQLLSIYKNTI